MRLGPARVAVVVLLLLSLMTPTAHAGSKTGDPELRKPELVATAGLGDGAFGVAVLGQLGDSLYVFGSQGETTGALAGVGVVTSSGYRNLGPATADGGWVDYNRLTPHGAVEYGGDLYVGDRRTGGLFRLVPGADGRTTDVERVLTLPSGEDVYPGPVLDGLLYLGSYGKDSGGPSAPDGSAMVMTFDGTTAQTVLDLSHLGHGGEVLSMTTLDGTLYFTASTKDRSRGDLWSIRPGSRPQLLHTGRDVFQVQAVGGELLGVRQSFDDDSSPRPYVARWDGRDFQRLTKDFADIGTLAGLMTLGDDLLVFHYYEGIYRFRDGALSRISKAPPRVTSAKVFAGDLWLTGNQPPSVWRLRLSSAVRAP